MHLGTDRFMSGKLKFGAQTRKMVFHYNSMLFEQLRAMLPITLLQASCSAVIMDALKTAIV